MTKIELFDLLWEINYLAMQVATAENYLEVERLLDRIETTTCEIYDKYDKEN